MIAAEAKNRKSSGTSLNASSATGTPDHSDGEGSETNFHVLVAPGESSSSRLSDDSSTTDDQKAVSKQFTAYIPTDPTRGPSTQNDARLVQFSSVL